MDEDLDRVKDQLEDLSKTLDRMKDGETVHPGRGPSPSDTAQHERAATQQETEDEQPNRSKDVPDNTSREDGDDTHPSQLERFRDKLDHGHEAADQQHFDEAQTIYRSLIQDYRSLKKQDKLTEDDKERLHELYDKVDRAKE